MYVNVETTLDNTINYKLLGEFKNYPKNVKNKITKCIVFISHFLSKVGNFQMTDKSLLNVSHNNRSLATEYFMFGGCTFHQVAMNQLLFSNLCRDALRRRMCFPT